MSRFQLAGDAAVVLEVPSLPSLNALVEATRGSYREGASMTRALRKEGRMVGLNWLNSPTGRPLRASLIYFGVRREDLIRRDIHNLLIKPFIDGLVDAGIWPDDNEFWIPCVVLHYLGLGGPSVTIEIHEIDTDLLTAKIS